MPEAAGWSRSPTVAEAAWISTSIVDMALVWSLTIFVPTAKERTAVLSETERLADDSLLDDGHSRWHCVYRVLFQKHFNRRHSTVAETVLVGGKVKWPSTSRNKKQSIC